MSQSRNAVEIGDWVSVPKEKPHPRLFFDREEIPAIRAFAEECEAARPLVRGILEAAEGWRDTPVRVPEEGAVILDGTPGEAQKTHQALRNVVRDLGLAYVLTEEEAYAQRVKEILTGYGRTYRTYAFGGSKYGVEGPSGSNQGRIFSTSLSEAAAAVEYAWAYDLIADSGVLSKEEKAGVEEGFLRGLYETMMSSREWKDGGKPTEWPNSSNHGSHRNAAVGVIGYALGDEGMVNEAITGPLGLLMQFETMYLDGAILNEESFGYHFYALRGHLDLMEAALNNGLNLYAASPVVKRMFLAPPYVLMPNGRFPAIGDSHSRPISQGIYALGYLRYRDERLAAFVKPEELYGDSLSLFCLLERFEPSAVSETQSLPGRNFPETGLGVLRSGGDDPLYALLLYGPDGGNHGHRDKLSLVVYGAGEVLGHDDGPAFYRDLWRNNWFRQTFAHNAVSVDRQPQAECRGQSEGFFRTPLFQLASASADEAYAGVRHARSVLMVSDRYLVVVDALDSEEAHTYDWCYHCEGKLERGFEADSFATGNLPPYKAAGGQLAMLEDVCERKLAEPWWVRFQNGEASLRLTMPGGEPATVFTGLGPRGAGRDEEPERDRLIWDLPMVFARREAASTVFAAVLEPGRAGLEPAEEIELLDATFPVRVRLRFSGGVEDEVTLFSPRDTMPPAWAFRADRMNGYRKRFPEEPGRASYVRRINGEVAEAALLNGRCLQTEEMEVRLNPPGSISMVRDAEGWTVYSSAKAGTEITLAGVLAGRTVRKAGAAQDLIVKTFEGETTFALAAECAYRIL